VKFPSFPLAVWLLLGPASPVSAAVDLHDLARQSARKLGLQTEIPSEVSDAASHWNLHLSDDLLRFLLWGTVILGVLVIVWSLRDSLPVFSRSRKIVAREEAPLSSVPSSRMEEAQIEADDLARQGHYSEAMHLLLLKSLNEIRRQLGINFAVSLTSREILRRIQLSDIGRRALAAIIQAVERIYFGGQEAGQADYAECRDHFDALRHSLAAVARA
jgi:hypothetical protein